ncbi:hypothetical protein [Burkholderia sp. BCC0405]|uniref:hypothetical protein n=1 Tax=Burkholderia sp. BCC0405 TaxID=2676298 RepID=UPI00158997D9|nr:hypothetical protein [Burkholderia sp. BCC0405]
MEQVTELTIAAQSDDEFDELCDRAEALAGVVVGIESKAESLHVVLVAAYRYDEANLTVTFLLNTEAMRLLDLSVDGRTTLETIEGITLH